MSAGQVPVGVFVGLTTLDVIHRSRRAPGPDEKMTAERQDLAAGGPAANAAVVFAALGGHARLVTALGTGPAASVARADLETHGVEIVDLAAGRDVALGVSAVRVDSVTGERSVLSMDAVGSGLDLDALPVPDLPAATGARQPGGTGLLADADVVLVDGHHPVIAAALAREAADAGVPVLIDAGRWKPVMAEILPGAHTVVASADFRLADGEHPEDGRPGAGRGGTTRWAVTHGAGPITWWTASSTGRAAQSGEVEVPSVAAVDTLGAGDAVHGALAWEMTQARASFAEELSRAARVAALRCSVVGPRDWLRLLPGQG